jgi:hypothetical protein
MKLNSIIFHPILFGIFPVLSLFENNMSFTPVREIVLPAIIIILVIIPTWIFLKIIIKDNKKSAFIISLSLILFFAYGPIFSAIDDITINGEDVGRHFYLMIIFLGIWVGGAIFLIKTKKEIGNITTISNFVSLIIIGVMLFSIVGYNLENSYSVKIEEFETRDIGDDITQFPDIYYILLDGYPGKTSLENISGYDNQEFLTTLEKQGFFIQEKSYANYSHTFLSIPSILNMKYLNDMASELDASNLSDQSIPFKIGSDNKVMNFIKSQGYVTVSFDSGWGFTKDMKSADLKLCGDNKIFNSEFMITIVKNSMLNPIYVKVFESSKVEGVLCIFDELPKIKERTDQPIFAFAHIFSPHPPYIFEANGNIRNLDNIDPHLETEDNLDTDAFVNQLIFINKKITEVVNELLDSENQPIIIIQSDHGTAFLFDGNAQNWVTPTSEMINERADGINFIFLPKNMTNIFSESVTPVNTFPILFNHYFETDFKILDDKIYFGKDGSYNLKDVTDIVLVEPIN